MSEIVSVSERERERILDGDITGEGALSMES